MQRVIGGSDGEYRFLELPDADEWLMDGVRWGSFEHPLTPAFWVTQAWLQGEPAEGFALCANLVEEVVTCLLGGHGAPAEVGLAASSRVIEALRGSGSARMSVERAEELLRTPLSINGREIRYRFAGQRARYLHGCLEGLSELPESGLDDVELRDALCGLPGIGPKTASWIVRNRRGSDEVAILDVHIVRACEHMGVFPKGADPARRYFELETRFLEFCRRGEARASVVDAVMWATMRKLSRPMLKLLVDPVPAMGEPLPLFAWGEEQCPAVGEAAAITAPAVDLVRA
ncbi:endonuclease III domain-containing protein [Phenylobacterium sp.]|uniref:endonuclease III domain-containing protein n=1 Tax=Phenylobacterium sp. TaxID=1871053 RepID=UPI00273176CF|nr:endonuclease III domain-containing protein [Phenylobacterium sp.]MDP1616522.1 endonuclease III domain-containing protein [Phenylobacterium sp.]MDP1985936.1 endonuclease III domain-containing protein [Phenylobacterium sp.]